MGLVLIDTFVVTHETDETHEIHEAHEMETIRRRARAASLVVPLVVIASSVGCSDVLPERSRAIPIRAACPEGPEYYVPSDAIDTRSASQERWRSEYVGLLQAARARSISCESRDGDTYRFTLLPSFDPAVVFTLTQSDGWILSTTTINRASRERWKIAGAGAGSVSPAAAARVLTALDDADFWSSETWRESTVDDGTTWIFEARRGDEYRLVVRHEPKDEPLRAAGGAFFDLANLPVPGDAIER